MKYQLAIIDQFEMIWLEDLNNLKLGTIQIISKIVYETVYVVSVLKEVENLPKEVVGIKEKALLGFAHYVMTSEVVETTLRVSKLIRILAIRKG